MSLRMRLLVACSGLILALVANSGGMAAPAALTVKLRIANRSGLMVCKIYISSVTSDEWGDNWLGSRTLRSGSL